MNSHIASYFDQIEARFISSPAVITYQVLRRDISDADGLIRRKARMTDSSQGEFFENVIEANSQIRVRKYSFHWQDKDGQLIRRWDNAAHHKEFSSPHHLHLEDGTVTEVGGPLSILQVILEIEIELANKGQ